MKKSGVIMKRSGFTLIELLVVILIIIVLTGIVFKLSKGAMANADRAKEIARVSIIKSIIEEFHAEYGIYPPVDPNRYGINAINYTGPYPDPVAPEVDLRHYITGDPSFESSAGAHDKVFCFGLFSFFVNRYDYVQPLFFKNLFGESTAEYKTSKDQWKIDNDDIDSGVTDHTARDRAFVARVKPFVRKIGINGPGTHYYDCPPAPSEYFTRGFDTGVHDIWDRGYYYISYPPHTSYLFFSAGPDGMAEEPYEDRTLPKNRDNVYGDVE